MMIASYMDDDDSIVYGGDFLVTQQEQDKRILGVRIMRKECIMLTNDVNII